MWFRRDLRLDDHPALVAASEAGSVVPLFVVDPLFTRRAGAPRRAYMATALQALDDELGGALVYRHGDPTEVVPRFASEFGASEVFVSRDFAPYGRTRDAEVARRLRADARILHGIGSPYAVDPGNVVKSDGSPYAVFTPFSKAWVARGWPAPVARPDVGWLGAPDLPCDGPSPMPSVECSLPPATRAGVAERWATFHTSALDRYDEGRNLLATDGTSGLSTALRWGLVHPRQLLAELEPCRGHDVFRSELAWREFYADVLFRRPETAWRNLSQKMDAMAVDTDDSARSRFYTWAAGRTGFPIVDAGMRQLLATGWMHNRARMITASFLVKDLHLPWQWGARHFMRHLVDGDLASNSHGWQWVAGTGTDAAPYFRIFNPTAQSQRFDPEGEYIRRWVPELGVLHAPQIHEPGLFRPADYPSPMVEHAIERAEALRRYQHVGAGSR